ncbi:MAG: YraN family protein [Candidatus Firestonebacteria bacterium]
MGAKGEEIATDFLKQNGYKILARNYKSNRGEIDIIAEDKNTITFVEVKTRKNNNFSYPQEAVDVFKQQHIKKTALEYLVKNKLTDSSCRFDVIAISEENNIEFIKNAF